MTDVIVGWIVALALVFVSRPTRVTCREGYFVDGVRPNGKSTCRQVPPKNCGEPSGPWKQACPKDVGDYEVAVHCTSGTRPIVVNERTIGCQR